MIQIIELLTPEIASLAALGGFLVCLILMLVRQKDRFDGRAFWLVLTVGAVLLLLQFSQTFLDFDDYGYAALSYRDLSYDVPGLDYSLGDILNFLRMHYLHWGGRILYFFIEILLLRQSLWLFRIVEATLILIWLVLVCTYVVRQNKRYRTLVLLILFTLYGLMEVTLVRDGVYWYTAAVLYVFPVLPATGLIFAYSSATSTERRSSKRNAAAMGVLALIASFSQEQISAGLLGVICLIAGIRWLIQKEKLCVTDYSVIAGAILGFLLLLFCPGSLLRSAEVQTTMLQRLKDNYRTLDYILFGSSNMRLFMVTVFFASSFAAFGKYRKKGRFCIVSLIFSALCFVIGGCWISGKAPIYYMNSLPWLVSLPEEGKKLLRLAFFLVGCLYCAQYCISRRRIGEGWMACAACLSLLPGFVSTGIGMRMMVPFCLMLFPLLGSIFVDSIDICLSQKEIGIKLVTLATAGYLVVFSAYNYQTILRGYAVNRQIRLHNAMLLEEAVHTGEKEIHLKRLTDDTYASKQPYQSGYEFIEKYIREYYALSKDAVFFWE